MNKLTLHLDDTSWRITATEHPECWTCAEQAAAAARYAHAMGAPGASVTTDPGPDGEHGATVERVTVEN